MKKLFSSMLTEIFDFAGRKDNPHKVNPTQLDTYTEAEMREKLKTRMPSGILPISYFSPVNNRIFKEVYVTLNGDHIVLDFPNLPEDNNYIALIGTNYVLTPTVTAYEKDSYLFKEGDSVVIYLRLVDGEYNFTFKNSDTTIPITLLCIPVFKINLPKNGERKLITNDEKFNNIWIDGLTVNPSEKMNHGQSLLSTTTSQVTVTRYPWLEELL